MRILRRNLVLRLFASLALFCTIAAGQDKATPAGGRPPYKNPVLAINDRVADLLSRMTLEEKVGQIVPSGADQTSVIDPTGTFTDETARAILTRWWDPDVVFTPKKSAILRNGVQRYLREKTRLGIPELFMGESLHGFMEYGSTSFPQALGLASTWDPALVKQVFTAAGDEAGSPGAAQGFPPVPDLAPPPLR